MDKKEKELKTNVILTEGLWEKSKIRAAKDRITLSELVRRSLREHLEKRTKEERLTRS